MTQSNGQNSRKLHRQTDPASRPGQRPQETNASAWTEIRVDGVPHSSDGKVWRVVSQGVEDMALEPRVNVIQHCLRHLFLAAREEVIKATLSQAGFFGDPTQWRTFVVELPEDFGDEGYYVRALIERPREIGLAGLKAQIRQPVMVIRAPAKWPMEFAVCFFDQKMVDASEPMLHEASAIIFPVLIAVWAEPAATVVVPLIGIANTDSIAA
jgi:hypothetical protein